MLRSASFALVPRGFPHWRDTGGSCVRRAVFRPLRCCGSPDAGLRRSRSGGGRRPFRFGKPCGRRSGVRSPGASVSVPHQLWTRADAGGVAGSFRMSCGVSFSWSAGAPFRVGRDVVAAPNPSRQRRKSVFAGTKIANYFRKYRVSAACVPGRRGGSPSVRQRRAAVSLRSSPVRREGPWSGPPLWRVFARRMRKGGSDRCRRRCPKGAGALCGIAGAGSGYAFGAGFFRGRNFRLRARCRPKRSRKKVPASSVRSMSQCRCSA